MPEDDLRASLRLALEDALARSRADWEAAGFAPRPDLGAPGSLYRVPDIVAAAHAVRATAKLAVLRREGDVAVVAPFSIDGPVEAGDVLIPPSQSPYGVGGTGAIVLHLWARGRLPVGALSELRAGGTCPAVAALPIDQLVYAVPAARQGLREAWRSLLAALASGGGSDE